MLSTSHNPCSGIGCSFRNILFIHFCSNHHHQPSSQRISTQVGIVMLGVRGRDGGRVLGPLLIIFRPILRFCPKSLLGGLHVLLPGGAPEPRRHLPITLRDVVAVGVGLTVPLVAPGRLDRSPTTGVEGVAQQLTRNSVQHAGRIGWCRARTRRGPCLPPIFRLGSWRTSFDGNRGPPARSRTGRATPGLLETSPVSNLQGAFVRLSVIQPLPPF